MALHKDLPTDPYAILDPNTRWFPADEDSREKGAIQKLLPPLVAGLREKVKEKTKIMHIFIGQAKRQTIEAFIGKGDWKIGI